MTARLRLGLLPLRVRLVAGLLALVALGLLVAGTAATSVLRRSLVQRVDTQLVAATADPRRIIDSIRPPDPSEQAGATPLDRFYVLISEPDGAGTSNSSAPARPSLPLITSDVAARRDGQPFTTSAVQGGGHWRVLVSQRSDGSSLTLASSLDDVEATESKLVTIEAVVGLAVLALLAVLAYVLVRRSLQPLREVEQTAAAIAGGDLSLRVPRQDDRTEVGRLALAFNSMLGRIEGAFRAQQDSEAAARESEARLRRFVADASHELRTPLTSIRGFAELYRQGAVPPGADLDRVMSRVEGEATRMGQLVEEMLLLARLDQQRPLEQAPVDLLRLTADAVHDARAVDPERPFALDVPEAEHAPVVLGDEARLRQVLVNLLGNALTHTPAGSPVTVRLRTSERTAVVEVADEGPGLTAEQAEHVFDRFYRADTARTRASGGTGLGLSIVQAVVDAHGGSVHVRSAPGAGATFVVELPLVH